MIINEMPGLALGSTTATAAMIQTGKTAYDGSGNLITGTLNPSASNIKSGVTIAGVTGTLLNQSTTANAATIFNGKKAYSSSGAMITGTALSSTTTVAVDDLPEGVTAYTNTGVYLTGTGILLKKAFSLCTPSEIQVICDAGKAADYVANGIWSIGDTNSNFTYGSYSGIRLYHVLTSDQMSTYSTSGHIMVGFVNTVSTSQWNSNYNIATSYSASTLLSAETTIYNGTSNNSVFKKWKAPTSVQNSSTSSGVATSVEYVDGYFHSPNCKELSSENEDRISENSVSFTWTYFSNGALSRRKKSGEKAQWWLRSPGRNSNGTNYYAYFVDSGGYDYTVLVNGVYGVAPVGCI